MRVPPCSFPPLAGAHVGRAAVVIAPSPLYAAGGRGIETLAGLLALAGPPVRFSPWDLGATEEETSTERENLQRGPWRRIYFDFLSNVWAGRSGAGNGCWAGRAAFRKLGPQ
jgi:hypothetical protein